MKELYKNIVNANFGEVINYLTINGIQTELSMCFAHDNEYNIKEVSVTETTNVENKRTSLAKGLRLYTITILPTYIDRSEGNAVSVIRFAIANDPISDYK